MVAHPWPLAVAAPGAGEFICSNSPLTWATVEMWEPGYKTNERLDDPNVTVMFPLNKKLALITRPRDRSSKRRGFRYEAIAEVVAWVNTRTLFLSYGTAYSGSKDYGLLQKGNKVGRSTDYFRYVEYLRGGARRTT